QAEDGIRDRNVTGVQTCALPIWSAMRSMATILPPAIVKPNIICGLPPGAHTSPGNPLTSAGCAARARPEKVSATAAAPRTSLGRSEERRVGKEGGAGGGGAAQRK